MTDLIVSASSSFYSEEFRIPEALAIELSTVVDDSYSLLNLWSVPDFPVRVGHLDGSAEVLRMEKKSLHCRLLRFETGFGEEIYRLTLSELIQSNENNRRLPQVELRGPIYRA